MRLISSVPEDPAEESKRGQAPEMKDSGHSATRSPKKTFRVGMNITTTPNHQEFILEQSGKSWSLILNLQRVKVTRRQEYLWMEGLLVTLMLQQLNGTRWEINA